MIITAIMLATAAYSQKGMHINAMFNGEGKWKLKFSAAHIEGNSLKPYDLTTPACTRRWNNL